MQVLCQELMILVLSKQALAQAMVQGAMNK